MQSQFSIFPWNAEEVKTGKKLKTQWIRGGQTCYIQMDAYRCIHTPAFPLRASLIPFCKAQMPTGFSVQKEVTKQTPHWLFRELTLLNRILRKSTKSLKIIITVN